MPFSPTSEMVVALFIVLNSLSLSHALKQRSDHSQFHHLFRWLFGHPVQESHLRNTIFADLLWASV